MKLTYVDDMACLEHDELIYLKDEQYRILSTLNAIQSKDFLIQNVIPGLTEKEKVILNRWLADLSIDWHLQIKKDANIV
jgi:hypothetical protein